MVNQVSWPKGLVDFYYKVRLNAETILTGTVVAVDPASGASSMPGFALYHAGVLQLSGSFDLNNKLPIQDRLNLLYEKVLAISPTTPDVFVLEKLRGRMVHPYLSWAAGVCVAASRAPVMIEVPIPVWKAFSKTQTDYTKTDENDAIMQGGAVIQIAKETPRVGDSGVLSVAPNTATATSRVPKGR